MFQRRQCQLLRLAACYLPIRIGFVRFISRGSSGARGQALGYQKTSLTAVIIYTLSESYETDWSPESDMQDKIERWILREFSSAFKVRRKEIIQNDGECSSTKYK